MAHKRKHEETDKLESASKVIPMHSVSLDGVADKGPGNQVRFHLVYSS